MTSKTPVASDPSNIEDTTSDSPTDSTTDLESHTVTEDAEGTRLDVWLHRQFDFLPSRSFASQWISAGHVQVERTLAKPSLKIRTGDRIHIKVPENPGNDPVPQAENIPLRILFEDDHLIVINKPAGLVVHPGAGVPSGTLVNAILWHCGSTLPSLGAKTRAGIVHRLDRDTSGVMVVAKSQIALTQLSQDFAHHAHVRRYQAICYVERPSLELTTQTLESGYGRHPNHRTQYAVFPLGQGKRACTHIQRTETLLGGLVARFDCSLETGRTHQIRVHMTHLGHPLVGDQVYGKAPEILQARQPQAAAWLRKHANRQMLHAQLLGFKHPVSQHHMEFRAELEPDMTLILEHLRALESP